MPQRAPHPCAAPGCPALVRQGRYCPKHESKTQALYDLSRGSSASRGYGSRWRRLRRMYLNAYPICADPDDQHPGRVIAATDVDHITPLRSGGTNQWENLQALCHECHSHKTAVEDGRWKGIGEENL